MSTVYSMNENRIHTYIDVAGYNDPLVNHKIETNTGMYEPAVILPPASESSAPPKQNLRAHEI